MCLSDLEMEREIQGRIHRDRGCSPCWGGLRVAGRGPRYQHKCGLGWSEDRDGNRGSCGGDRTLNLWLQ